MTDDSERGEKRRHLRIPLKVEVHVEDRWDPPEWAINVSCGGIGLQAREPRTTGDRLRIRFRLAPESAYIETDACVVWCMEESDLTPGMQYYEVGLRFIDLEPAVQEAIVEFVSTEQHFWPEEDPWEF